MSIMSMPRPERFHGPRESKSHLPAIAAALTLAMLSTATTLDAQVSLGGGSMPHAIFCEKEGVIVIGYLARINSDGSAVYMTPSNIVVEVSPEGVVDNRADGSCAGKRLSELLGNGQAFGFAHEAE